MKIKDDILTEYNKSENNVHKGLMLSSLSYIKDSVLQFKENFKVYTPMIKVSILINYK